MNEGFQGSERLVEEYLEGLLVTATDESSVYQIYNSIYRVNGAFTDTNQHRPTNYLLQSKRSRSDVTASRCQATVGADEVKRSSIYLDNPTNFKRGACSTLSQQSYHPCVKSACSTLLCIYIRTVLESQYPEFCAFSQLFMKTKLFFFHWNSQEVLTGRTSSDKCQEQCSSGPAPAHHLSPLGVFLSLPHAQIRLLHISISACCCGRLPSDALKCWFSPRQMNAYPARL